MTFIDKIFAQKGYNISMELTGFKENTKFYLVDLDLGKAIDSILFKEGKGQFSGIVKEPVGCRIQTVDRKYLILQLENCNIKIRGSYKDFYYCSIEGSELNKIWMKYRDFQKSTENERDSLMQLFIQTPDSKPDLSKKILSRVKTIDSINTQYRLSLIKNEKPSYFTIKELFYLRNDLSTDTLKRLFSLFPEELQKTKYGDVIQTYIKNIKPPVVGDKAIDIEGFDMNNKPHQLSELKGKYVLLEFWASWCGPCIGEIPNMKKALETFKDRGFEIYSFSVDANIDNWKKAIEKNNITWINVTDSKGLYSTIAAKYGVRAIPKNYLIDRAGVIIGKDLRGGNLSKKLDEILNK